MCENQCGGTSDSESVVHATRATHTCHVTHLRLEWETMFPNNTSFPAYSPRRALCACRVCLCVLCHGSTEHGLNNGRRGSSGLRGASRALSSKHTPSPLHTNNTQTTPSSRPRIDNQTHRAEDGRPIRANISVTAATPLRAAPLPRLAIDGSRRAESIDEEGRGGIIACCPACCLWIVGNAIRRDECVRIASRKHQRVPSHHHASIVTDEESLTAHLRARAGSIN